MSSARGHDSIVPERVPILVVEDDVTSRRLASRILRSDGHLTVEAGTVAEARDLLKTIDCGMALLDMNLPDESGMRFLAELRGTHPAVASIMVTGEDRRELAEAALEHGAYGYIMKPFSRNELLIQVSNGLRRRRLELEQRSTQVQLERIVEERTRELWNSNIQLVQREEQLRLANEETIQRLALASEFRDDDTARHVKRVSEYSALIARLVGFDGEQVSQLRLASVLHDVGKIGVPDDILRKPGALTDLERREMQKHTDIGHKILADSHSELLDVAASIALTHHERWDGHGYPRGLGETDIPLPGRITAVADVFDALSTDRVYRKAYSLPVAVSIMKDGCGTQFDPEVLGLFLGSL
ncbi:MAG: response regulator, partial [Actinomycetota bacterium]|nr:response regulator [Actinomycetota bacterium]